MRAGKFLGSSLSVVLGFAGVAQAAPAAAAETGWGPVVEVYEPTRNTFDPELAVDPDGDTVAVWVRGGHVPRLLVGSRRQGTTSWSTPEVVPGTGGALEAEVAFDGDGDLVVAWAAGRRVRVVRRSAGGSWDEARTVHRTPAGTLGTRPTDLDLAVNARGRAVVSWRTEDDNLDRIYVPLRVQAVVGGPGARWGRARTLSSAEGFASDAMVAMSRAGRATVVWQDNLGGDKDRVMTSSRAPGQSWGRSVPLSRRLVHATSPQLAALPSGELAVAWVVDGSKPGIKLRRWHPGDGWGRVATVPGLKGLPWWPTIDMDGSGKVTVAWSNTIEAVWVAVHDPEGSWTRTRIAPPGSRYYLLHLEVNRAGDAVLGWDGGTDRRQVPQAAYRPRGGAWEPAITLSDPLGWGSGVAVGLAGDGTATAAWRGSGIQARTYEVR